MNKLERVIISIIGAAIIYFTSVATKNELSFTGANIFTAIVIIGFYSLFVYAGVTTVDKITKKR